MSRLLVPLFCILICFSIGAESIPSDSSFVPPCCTYEETPQLIHAIEPDYPDSLQELNIQGDVGLWLYINAQGSVDTVRLVQSLHPTLDRKAIESLQNSRWLPARKGIKRSAIWINTPITFSLSSPKPIDRSQIVIPLFGLSSYQDRYKMIIEEIPLPRFR